MSIENARRLPVILALCQTELAVHDELCGGFKVGVAVGDGLGVLRRELAQNPCGKVVVRVGLCADADADAGEVLPAQPGNDALQTVVPACRAGGPDAQLAGGLSDIVAQDDDVFVCKEIPSGFDDPPVLDPEVFEKLVTNDGESATVDYAAVRNCVEVFGATIEADGAATVKGWSGANKTINLVLDATESTWKSETKVSFVAPANVEAAKTDKNGNVTSGAMTVVLTFTWKYKDKDGNEQVGSETKTSTLYRSLTDANGSDIIQDPGCIKATKYYVLQWNPNTGRIYFLGQQQSHAMAKLVDEIPATKEIEAQKAEDNCDNMAFICVNDPNNIDDLYNARLSIEKIGRRTEILSGGDYENYTTDDAAMEVCQYELWKRARLTDGLSVTTRLVPWLDVNEKIQYAAKYLGGKTPVDWIIKSISMNLGEGTMSLSMSRYYPYYTYIVNNKYTFYQDNLFDKYFPELTATTADEQ